MRLSLTQCAQKTVACAAEEAAKHGQKFVLPEHLLLALLREEDSDAARALAYRGIAREELRAAVETRAETVAPPVAGESFLAPRLLFALERAQAEAESFGFRFAGTEHLLVGLIAEGNGLPARMLARQGLTLETAREAVIEALWDGREVRLCPVPPRVPTPIAAIHTGGPKPESTEIARAIAVIYHSEQCHWNIIAPGLLLGIWGLITLFLLGSALILLNLPGFVLFLFSAAGMGTRICDMRREYAAARYLSQSDSKGAIHALIGVSSWSDRKIRCGAEAALTRLLPTLRAGDGALLTLNDRITLGRKLSPRLAQNSPDFTLAILTAFERVGVSSSIYYVRPLTLNPPKTVTETRIYEAANRCLRALEWRAAHQDAHWTLLRPSGSSADSPDVLLRPASAAETVDPTTMLRPASPPKPENPA